MYSNEMEALLGDIYKAEVFYFAFFSRIANQAHCNIYI